MSNWLEQLKPGDEVVLKRSFFNKNHFDASIVTRISAKRVWATTPWGEKRFRKRDGIGIVEGCSLIPMSEGVKEDIEARELRASISMFAEPRSIGKIGLNQLRLIAEAMGLKDGDQ